MEPEEKKAKPFIKTYLAPIIIGILAAVIVIMAVREKRSQTEVKTDAGGVYTAYLADSSLTKIDSYSVTSVKETSDGRVIYDAGSTTIKAGNGSLIVKNKTETDVYTNAFILKDK